MSKQDPVWKNAEWPRALGIACKGSGHSGRLANLEGLMRLSSIGYCLVCWMSGLGTSALYRSQGSSSGKPKAPESFKRCPSPKPVNTEPSTPEQVCKAEVSHTLNRKPNAS